MGHQLDPAWPTARSSRPGEREGRGEGRTGKRGGSQAGAAGSRGSLALLGAGAPSQAHVIQPDLPGVAAPPLALEDDALDVRAPQGDVCPPPAVAAVSAPQCCPVATGSPHGHLERARVQPGHFVPEGQAQVPRVQEVAKRQHQACGSAPGGLGRHGQVLSTCWVPDRFPVHVTVLLPDPSTEAMVKVAAVHKDTWIILSFIICADPSLYLEYLKQVI